jgi:DEAD/DEAH box helicase domain-containing protein
LTPAAARPGERNPFAPLENQASVSGLLVFDVETKNLAEEVGGWDHIRDLGLAVAVTYEPETGTYRSYQEAQAGDLVDALRAAKLVVGYNVLRFDCEVLRAYTEDTLADLPTVDILRDLYRALGWRPKLDSVAGATLGEHKSADGVQAVEWFRTGQVQRVIDYCRQDVEVTWRLYEFGRSHRYVQVWERGGRARRVPVTWT